MNLLCKKALISEIIIKKKGIWRQRYASTFKQDTVNRAKVLGSNTLKKSVTLSSVPIKAVIKGNQKSNYFFFQQICKFGDHCLYKYSISSHKSEIEVLIQEVKSLKANIVILGDKVIGLEKYIVTNKSE